jgi:hypothetical protein
MFEKGRQNGPEWLTMPVENEPPGGFPIVFSYSRQVWLFTAVLFGAMVCIFLVIGWYAGNIPRTGFILGLPSMFALLLAAYYGPSGLQIHSDHFMMGLQKIPYRDIMAVTVQTTRAGCPIRMSVKIPSRTLYLEGFVCMDVLVRELLARAKSHNAWMSVGIHRGPTTFQLRLLAASVAVIGVFLLLTHINAGWYLWTMVGIGTVIGIHLVLHLAQKDMFPKPSPETRRWRQAATVFMILLFLMPAIGIGIMFLMHWHNARIMP